MRTLWGSIGRGAVTLLVLGSVSFGAVEALRGSGERVVCEDCRDQANPDTYCSGLDCCSAPGSICLFDNGDCLCR